MDSANSVRIIVSYKECLKNHAANTGRYVVDGCREFMPTGEHGTSLALVCAACCCHRNFHRRVANSEDNVNKSPICESYLRSIKVAVSREMRGVESTPRPVASRDREPLLSHIILKYRVTLLV